MIPLVDLQSQYRGIKGEIDSAITIFVLPLATVVLSWTCMHMLFATHYAHRYYGDNEGMEPSRPGLLFPEPNATPGYGDFVYFSFCIGMTYQVSDVMTVTRPFRNLVTIHGALSFFYNTFVLALAVSLFGTLAGMHG